MKRKFVIGLLVLAGISLSGCQGEVSQGGGDTTGSEETGSGDSGINIQINGGTFDGDENSAVASETTSMEMDRFSQENMQAVDEFINQQMDEANLPSVAVGVWSPEGEYIFVEGESNIEEGEDRSFDQPFRIASITKTFTATAILQLVDEGEISTSDRLSKWYPDFPNADEITIDDLLKMRSGIPDFADEEFLSEWYTEPEIDFTAQDAIDISASKEDEFKAPGQETVYTNVNYVLLEEIVRKVSGEPLGERIESEILQPLEMDGSSYPTDYDLPGGLQGYSLDPDSGEFQNKTVLNPAVAGGAGAMISTAPDLRKFSKALCEGDLLEPATQEARLQTDQMKGDPEFVRYGQGVVTLGEFCGHNGTIFGFSSEMFYLPEEEAVIVVNVNRLDVDDQSQSTNIFLGVSKILYPDHVDW